MRLGNPNREVVQVVLGLDIDNLTPASTPVKANGALETLCLYTMYSTVITYSSNFTP